MHYKQEFQTNNKTPWINTKEFIILHHAATSENSLQGVLKTLTIGAVSCHYVIDTTGDIYKIWKDDEILRHCWESCWGNKHGMNQYSIWIEIIWPLANWFTFAQKKSARELIKDLMQKYKIPKENILRHADICNLYSGQKVLWWGKTKARKVDIDIRFLNDSQGKPKYKDWKEYQNSF